jgi:hypothetical protein
MKLPTAGVTSDGSDGAFGEEDQVRAVASYSLADARRGRLTRVRGEVACVNAEATRGLELYARTALLAPRARALQSALSGVSAELERVERIEERTRAKFDARVIGIGDLDRVHHAAGVVRATVHQMKHDLAEIEPLLAGTSAERSPESLIRSFRDSAIDVARTESRLRSAHAWDIGARAGVVVAPVREYFGVLEVSYSLGQPFQSAAESRYRRARRDELLSEEEPLIAAARAAEGARAAVISSAGEELVELERELAFLKRTREAFQSSEAEQTLLQIDEIELREIAGNLRRAYLQTLLAHAGTTAKSSSAAETP